MLSLVFFILKSNLTVLRFVLFYLFIVFLNFFVIAVFFYLLVFLSVNVQNNVMLSFIIAKSATNIKYTYIY